jgi:hypothetical protein
MQQEQDPATTLDQGSSPRILSCNHPRLLWTRAFWQVASLARVSFLGHVTVPRWQTSLARPLSDWGLTVFGDGFNFGAALVSLMDAAPLRLEEQS